MRNHVTILILIFQVVTQGISKGATSKKIQKIGDLTIQLPFSLKPRACHEL